MIDKLWKWYDKNILGYEHEHVYQFREFKFFCKECGKNEER